MNEKLFVLVISMWGNDGVTNHPIGHVTLQQPMTEDQCQWLISDGLWAHSVQNEFYFMIPQCYPVDCAHSDKCS